MRKNRHAILAAMSRRMGRTVSIRGDAVRAKRISSKAIRERLGELHDQATALTNLAEKESRDLTEEEKTQFDAIMAEYKTVQDKDLPRAEWLEQEEERLASARIDARIANGDIHGTGGRQLEEEPAEGRSRRIVIPNSARCVGRLKSFIGETAMEDAYLSGMWLAATLFNRPRARKWCADNGLAILDTALTGGDNTLGGFLVPPEFARTLIRLVEEYGTFRRKARVWPMASDTTSIPRRLTGLTTYFVGDNTDITESNMTFDAITLTARKLAILSKWSSEIDEDSAISIADILAQEIAYAIAVKEDQCGFLGTGASTYGGIAGLITACTAATATTVTATAGNTSFGTLDLADFEAMIGKLPQFPGIRPEWYISKAGWAASMMRLADAAGGNTADVIEGKRQLSFLGFPVNLVQCMNSTLTVQASTYGLCYFGDLSMAATLGTRRGMTMAISGDRYFEYDQLAIRCTERFDINVHDVGDTASAGAVIMLATPAT